MSRTRLLGAASCCRRQEGDGLLFCGWERRREGRYRNARHGRRVRVVDPERLEDGQLNDMLQEWALSRGH